ncbi:MAG: hypothetical protein R3D55_28200 [Chloroflexota bacterium]
MSKNNRKWFLIFHALNLLSFGLPLLLMPAWMLDMYGLASQPNALVIPQMLGGVALGNMVMSWLIRDADFASVQRPYFFNQLVAWGGTFYAGLLGMLNGQMNVMGWMFVVNPLFWLILFGYMSLGQRRKLAQA